ncbi:MAG TPA: hypothetical protein PLS84_04240 [Salinivirgaceae bacterium]|jgi:hypothetical protein|nr:hypothetical protein [Salinivirgaceae bacterium]
MKKLAFILLVVLFAGCTVHPVEGSDSWYVEKIAKEHPDWSYDKIEDSMFLPNSVFTEKYGEK